jgi:hypothetical protein
LPEKIEAHPAILRWRAHTPQAELFHLVLKPRQIIRRQLDSIVLQLVLDGADVLDHQLARRVAQHLEMFGDFPRACVTRQLIVRRINRHCSLPWRPHHGIGPKGLQLVPQATNRGPLRSCTMRPGVNLSTAVQLV